MKLFIGLLSGTSVDGLDAALVKIDSGRIELIDFICHSIPSQLKAQIQQIISEKACSLEQLTQTDYQLGHECAIATNILLEKAGIKNTQVNAIGSHGQTVFHSPNGSNKTTLQISSPHVLTAKTGIKVVANFRNMDMALDGQGAPLAPILHQQLFKKQNQNTAVLNLGGIANITFLGKDFHSIIGYDTGPANCLMDNWVRIHKNKPYDENGDWAKSGKVNQALLEQMLNDGFFHKNHPKSTGRELFNLNWFENFKDEFIKTNAQDVQATLAHLTATSISLELKKHPQKIDEIVVMGGGAKNIFLLDLIHRYSNITVKTAEDYGYDSDCIEAILFAYLAYLRVNEITLDLSSITGSYSKLLLGDVIHIN